MINILILAAGTRNKIVQYFKETLGDRGRVVATDITKLAPAIYEADTHYIVPRITDPTYLQTIFDICQQEKITGVLSLIDPELSILAEHVEDFAKLGVTVIGSSKDLCDLAFDKMEMYRWLKAHNYNCAKSYDNSKDFYEDYDNNLINFPVYVKPIKGSASISVTKVMSKEHLDLLMSIEDKLMIQEFLDGQEIGVDCYIDLISGELVSTFLKKKLLMRAGETDKAVSFKDEILFKLVEKFVKECGWRGQIDIDIFDINGEFYISEVNPRFGGGYPHAYECGVNHMDLIINNLEGKENKKQVPSYTNGVYMMKYLDLKLLLE